MSDLPTGDRGFVTPDAVAVDLPLASVGSRGIALTIDVVVIGSGLVLLGLAEAAFDLGAAVPSWVAVTALLLLGFALQFGYPIGFETALRGRTPGKLAMGLRVVTVEGAPVGFRHAALRAVTAPLELTATVGGIAVVTALTTARSQRLGDLLAGTVVVRERRATGGQPRVRRFAAPPGLEGYVTALDVSGLGPREYTTVRDVLARLPSLRPREARELAEGVADALRDRVQPPPPAGLDAARWLACLAAAVQAGSTPAAGGPPPDPGSPPPASPAPGGAAGWGATRPTPPRAEGSASADGGFAPPR